MRRRHLRIGCRQPDGTQQHILRGVPVATQINTIYLHSSLSFPTDLQAQIICTLKWYHRVWIRSFAAYQIATIAMLTHPQSMCLQREAFVRVCQLLSGIAQNLPLANDGLSMLMEFISLKGIDIPDEACQLLKVSRSHTASTDKS